MSGTGSADEFVAGSATVWCLQPGWQFARSGNGLDFFTDVRRIRVSARPDLVDALLECLTTSGSGGAGPGVAGAVDDRRQLPRVLARLEHLRVVGRRPRQVEGGPQVDPADRAQAAYLERIGLEPTEAQAALGASCVLLLGLGGTGSAVLQHLVGAGIGGVVLVDFDIVESSNLGRQFVHSRATLGWPKTTSATAYAKSHSTSIRVRTENQKITSAADVAAILKRAPEVCAAAVCIDTPAGLSFDLCAEPLWQAGVPFIHGGAMTQSGFFGPLFAETHGSPPPARLGLGPTDRAALLDACFAPYNTMLGAYMAAELVHHLSGAGHLVDYRERTFVDWSRIRPEKIPASPDRVG
ncbi:HesA/MoeB/ThiF family protein [Streptomyces sp. IBSBF 3136]|uniref:HesA/MoeB/ThiF family protein n=1 Tax=Streptomyces sp. IBSBF 3136 TaxID=2903524 RepID=UPI002FDB9D67